MALPPAAKVTFAPNPFPAAVNTTGTTITITAKTAGGAVVAGVDVLFEITEGTDKAITSKINAGPDPTSTTTPPVRFVDTKLTSFTDATGTCTVSLISTGKGNDAIKITVATGPNSTSNDYKYETTVP